MPLTIVERLAYRINEIRHPQARACIVWLVGQYAADDSPNAVVEGVVPWAPDVFRKIAKSFRDEARGQTSHLRSVELAHTFPLPFFSPFLGGTIFFFLVQTVPVKLQAVTLAAKLLVLSPANGTLIQLAKYIFALARYDQNYDVRDRGRMLQQLLVGVVPNVAATDAQDVGGVVLRRAQVRVVLFEGKTIAPPSSSHPATVTEVHHGHDTARRGHDHDLGTLGLVLGRDVPNARLMPDWLEHGVESSLRYVPDDALPSSSATVVTAIGHVAPSSSRAGTGGHSTPVIVLTPGGSSGGPSPAGSVPNKAGWADLDAFYASESEEGEEEESEESEEEESEEGGGEEEDEDEDGQEEGEMSEDSDRQSREEEHEVRWKGILQASDQEDAGSDVEGASGQIAAVCVR